MAAQLVVFGFDSLDQARRAWSLGRRLRRRKQLDLADGALVHRDHHGKVTVRHLAGPGRTVALGGAVCGGVAGAVFLAPALGLALGAGAGALAGRLSRTGIDEALARRIAGHLQPGRAAMIVLARGPVDDVAAALRPHQPVVIMTTLPAEGDRRLARLLSQRPAPA
ncbi:DUF1269 domain-containing protein [Frankia sp. AgB32]|uniref:DUF1269 domain-containing protein n=1 Tax=Frankia sp. AgB32 TaxID=631119 RepID=UPI00200DDDF1|nr:DUF1269 domain-containing protein [Frankia sp. AgB32]MCK9897583.1 DUF1269 domain-containing protein [Frankia sp. AgB32]